MITKVNGPTFFSAEGLSLVLAVVESHLTISMYEYTINMQPPNHHIRYQMHLIVMTVVATNSYKIPSNYPSYSWRGEVGFF